MSKNKRSVHNTGALGLLLKSGNVSNIDNNEDSHYISEEANSKKATIFSYQTKSGLGFNERELTYIDPNICEPWKYANRLNDNMGDMNELMQSIKTNNQLQPALIRPHPTPYGKIKFEVIFGRRRHQACLKLNKDLLVILKDPFNDQEAILAQEAENRLRENVSNYSNALLYQRLLKDKIFKNEKDLSEKLEISLSKIYDILAFSKLPKELVQLIPDIHNLSNSIAIAINSQLKENPENLSQLLTIAHQIGKTLTSPAKLMRALQNPKEISLNNDMLNARIYLSKAGKKLFTLKVNHRGIPCIVFQKGTTIPEELCQHIKTSLEEVN